MGGLKEVYTLKHLAQGKCSVKISYFIVLILELISVLQGASFLDNYVKFCVYLHFPGRDLFGMKTTSGSSSRCHPSSFPWSFPFALVCSLIVGVILNSETSWSLRKTECECYPKKIQRGEKRETTKKVRQRKDSERWEKNFAIKYLIALYNTECFFLAYNPMLLDFLPTPKKDQYKLNW